MRVGVLGRIASGEEQGRYVLVRDDRSRTGGFLVLTAADREFSRDAADSWVESPDALERFADESNWIIEWEGGDNGG